MNSESKPATSSDSDLQTRSKALKNAGDKPLLKINQKLR
jgi:hypothetical protein